MLIGTSHTQIWYIMLYVYCVVLCLDIKYKRQPKSDQHPTTCFYARLHYCAIFYELLKSF